MVKRARSATPTTSSAAMKAKALIPAKVSDMSVLFQRLAERALVLVPGAARSWMAGQPQGNNARVTQCIALFWFSF